MTTGADARPARVQRGDADRPGARRAVRLPRAARPSRSRRRAGRCGAARDDRRPRGRRRQHGRHGREGRGAAGGGGLRSRRIGSESCACPHGGKGAAVRAGMLAADRATSCIFADADMATPPDQIPLLVAALARPRRRPGLADPARWLRHARDATGLSTATRQGVPSAGFGLGRRPGAGHAVRLQGVHARGRAGPVRAPARSRASCSTSS